MTCCSVNTGAAGGTGQPLTGVRVLIPRPAGRADELIDAVRAAGGDPWHVPLIATVPVTHSPALTRSLASLAAGEFDWFAVTSTATVQALRATADTAGQSFEVGCGVRVAAVGAATARALADAGLTVDLMPSAPGSARALAGAWPAEPQGGRVLLPHADRAASTLADALRAKGYRVTDVVAYRTETRPVPAGIARRLADGTIDAVLLTSPSTVAALTHTPIAAGTSLVAIGNTTARAITAAGLAVAAIASAPSTAGLMTALMTTRNAGPVTTSNDREVDHGISR